MRRPPRVLALLCALTALSLHAQPVAPTPEQVARLRALAVTPQPLATAPALSVDTSSREQVRQFYRSIYNASDGIPMGWTGNYTATDPVVAAGDTAAAFKEAVRLRINFFRALVGVPAAVTLNSTYSAKDQQAALMMSANNALNHYPPNTWTFYTADGATAAGNSNLAVGDAGPDAITGYMADSGSNNTVVGHRRWLFFPQTLQMGTGDVPGSATLNPANATWIIDGSNNDPRPATRTTQVTYPPAGYVPYQLVWPRWSFSYPGADFSSASVTMTRNSQSVAVAPEALATNVGENAFVWVYDGLPSASGTPHPKPSADTIYTVNVNGVKVGAATQNFSYTVTVFDPDVAGSDYTPATVSLPATLSVGQAASYTVAAPAFASHYEFRPLQLVAFTKTYNAESGLDGIVAQTESYPTVVTDTVGAGTASYHLAAPDTSILTQTLTLPETFYAANSAASLTFLSRLGYASAQQTAHVQLALDDGTAWFDAWAQTGTDGAGETSFTTRTVSLAAYAGRTFHVRFAYSYVGSGTWFPQTSAGVGWYLDNIALSGVQTATAGSSTVTPVGTGGTFTAAAAGSIGVQARGLFFGTYPMEWGPVAAVTVTTANPPATPESTGAYASGPTEITVTWQPPGSGSAPTGYKLERATNSAFSTGLTTFTLSTTATSYVDTTAAAGTNYYLRLSAVNAAGSSSPTATMQVQTPASAGSGASRFVNIATRAYCSTGNSVTIGGFVSVGSTPKRVLIRAVGPTLTTQGLGQSEVLADPVISLYQGPNVIASNDNWGDNTNAAAITSVGAQFGASPLAASDTTSAALLIMLNTGVYSFVVTGKGGTSGIVLIEVYDVDATPSSSLFVNIASRDYATTGNGVAIGGFVITGSAPKQVLVRAVGPTLTTQGLGQSEVLADPVISLYQGPNMIATNDNWGDNANAAAITSNGARIGATPFALTDTSSSALLLKLPPGVYSFIASGKGGTSGIVLVEVYDAD